MACQRWTRSIWAASDLGAKTESQVPFTDFKNIRVYFLSKEKTEQVTDFSWTSEYSSVLSLYWLIEGYKNTWGLLPFHKSIWGHLEGGAERGLHFYGKNPHQKSCTGRNWIFLRVLFYWADTVSVVVQKSPTVSTPLISCQPDTKPSHCVVSERKHGRYWQRSATYRRFIDARLPRWSHEEMTEHRRVTCQRATCSKSFGTDWRVKLTNVKAIHL